MSVKTELILQDKMSSVIRDINRNLGQTVQSMKDVEKSGAAAFGQKLAKGAATVGKAAAIATGAVVAGSVAAGKKLWGMANEVSQVGDNIDKMSQKIGISAEAYQEWGYVFERSGADVNQLQTGMKTLSSVITDAANGSSSAAEKLNAVGLSVQQLNGLSQDQQLEAVVGALQGMGSGAERTAAATDLLGRSATDMGAILNMTAEETAALRQEAEDYGMVMSNEAVAASANFDDMLTKMQGTVGGLKNRLIGDLLPGLSQVVDGFSNLVAGNEGASAAIEAGMSNVVSSISDMIPKAVGVLTSVGSAVMQVAPSIIESLADGMLSAVDSLAPVAGEMITKLTGAILKLLPKVSKTAVKLVVTLANTIAQQLPQLIPMAVEAIVAFTSGLVENLPLVLDAALQLIMGLAQGLLDALPTLIAQLPTIIVGICDFLVSAIPQIIQAGMDLLGALLDNTGAIIAALIPAVQQIIYGIVSSLLSHLGELAMAGVQLLVGLIASLPTAIAQIVAALPQVAMAMIQNLMSFVGGFKNVGVNLIKGLWNGIKDTVGWVVDRIKGLGTTILNAVKSIFHINSPSKETEWIGQMLGQGLANGITSSASDAVQASKAMSADVLSSVGDMNATAKIGTEYTGSAFTVGGGNYSPNNVNVVVNVDMSGMQNSIANGNDMDDMVTRLVNGIRMKTATAMQGVV